MSRSPLCWSILLALGCQADMGRRSDSGPGPAGGETGGGPAGAAAAFVEASPGDPSGTGLASGPSTTPAGAAAAVQPAVTLTLEEAIHTTLVRNPDLLAILQREGVSRAALEVARDYPFNPQLSVDVRPYVREPHGESGQVLVATSLLQEIELAGQGRYRREAGEADMDRTHWEILKIEVGLTAETGRRFFTALFRRQVHELSESMAKLSAELSGVVERRFQAGLATSTDVALARMEAQVSDQQAELARSTRDSALLELRRHLGLSGTAALEPSGDLASWPWLPGTGAPPQDSGPEGKLTLPRAVEELAGSRPDIRAAEAELTGAGARLDLASASRIPNISIGPVYEKDEAGTNFLGFETQVQVPLLNTGRSLVRQREAELQQSRDALEQLRLKAKLEAQAALSRYDAAWRLVSRFKGMTAGMEGDLQLVKDQYEAGQADILQVYAARTNLLHASQNYFDALYELSLSAVGLTEATALPPGVILFPGPHEPPQKQP